MGKKITKPSEDLVLVLIQETRLRFFFFFSKDWIPKFGGSKICCLTLGLASKHNEYIHDHGQITCATNNQHKSRQ